MQTNELVRAKQDFPEYHGLPELNAYLLWLPANKDKLMPQCHIPNSWPGTAETKAEFALPPSLVTCLSPCGTRGPSKQSYNCLGQPRPSEATRA